MAADEPGAALSSKYKLLRSLGAGGMGSVYLARDITLNRDVAIKFIALSKADDATARRRLVREAQAAAALDHPFICSVHEVSTETDGQPYIVMQFVEGETLADRLRRGPLDPRAALRWRPISRMPCGPRMRRASSTAISSRRTSS